MHFHSSTEKDVIVMLLPSNYFSVIFKPPAGSESSLHDLQEMQLSHGHLSPLWIEALLHEMCTKYIVHQERYMIALVLQELLFYFLTGSWDYFSSSYENNVNC